LAMSKANGTPEPEKPAFDIAKFAGIFAAIGMAVGMIGAALVSVAEGLSDFTWWQLLIVFVCILLVISGPSMIMAFMKLRRRNLAPVLNANGWAVNSDALISVLFGRTLTEQVLFPIVPDPLKKRHHLTPWAAACVYISILAILGLGGWGVYKYMTRDKVSATEVEQVIEPDMPAVQDETAGEGIE